ncbi:uncharacterized protein LOC142324217 isoform X2 [Lycorma delicatula]|uniref:uncharacterized protein LOC142324217 isoform X2 n=1 Tax=Lycorma delicatula TaxID=130591 RepID=UPI003F514415
MIAQRKHYACFYHITRLMILHLIVDSFQVKEEPLGNGCDNYNEVTDPLAFEGIKLIKSEDHAIKNEVESEILLNDDVASQPNLNMRTNEQINDLRPMKIEEEMWFYPGHSMDAQTNDSVLEENPLSLPIKKEDMHETGQQEYLFVHLAKTDDKLTIFKQSMDAQTDSSFLDEDPLSSSIKQEIKHETERTVHLIAPVAMIDDKLTTSRQVHQQL